MKMTLYRAGERSAIVDAAVRGAAAGKDVTTFVELKARFDEERNVRWAQQLRASGVHVVHGLVGLKTHAKLALVVRREGGTLRRYVHVGTGNYNAGTAKVYTDLGLFSADESLTADVSDLFNELTGSSEHPRGQYRRLLVAPHALLPRLLALVEREAQHARDGAPSGIRLKINGLSDAELIDTLYRASNAGVDIELIVRGVCRLRPGVPGMSERIRVLSILGRYLEHGRIYRFVNGGDPEYYIGSADWRPRNVRRRVETVASVLDPACRAKLDLILDRELADSSAWELMSNGGYHRATNASTDPGSASQTMFAAEAQLDAPAAPTPA
jgi:polyphosphate kinase